MRLGRKILVLPFLQGCYYLITLVWPLIHIKSFLEVTGYKRDIWLVDTVSFLLIPFVVTCFWISFNSQKAEFMSTLNMLLVSLLLGGIEIYYYLNGTLKWVYAVDALIQFFFAGWWINRLKINNYINQKV